MSETKAEYQARMGRKFDRLSAETTRLINENQALRKELANAPGRCEGAPPYVHDMIDLQETIDALRAELAALKGDQVPVAWRITPREGNIAYVETNAALIEKLGEIAFKVEPLFTAPQKPGVLPKEIEPYEVKTILDPTADIDEYSACVGADMWNAAIRASLKAIEAAGGKVAE